MPEQHTAATGGSASPTQLFPTPKAPDRPDADNVILFPTPRASDGPKGGPNQRDSNGNYTALPGAVVHLLPTPIAADSRSSASWRADGSPYTEARAHPTLTDAVRHLLPTPLTRDWKSGSTNLGTVGRPLSEVALLLKTPTANLGKNGAPQDPEKRRKGGHGPTLDDEVSFLLPHASEASEAEPEGCQSPDDWWGEYLPAIRRWEDVTGCPAPAPTEIGPRGGRRLAAPFAEWLMGIPGRVTTVPDLTRSQQIHKIGNGVVPQQAIEAYGLILAELCAEQQLDAAA